MPQLIGVLAPTPRGSKPMTSYCAATAFGSEEATNPASESPLPPGPPGFTSSGPWYVFAVCGTRERARVICRPWGLEWSSGTFKDAHWSVGYLLVPHFFQVGFAVVRVVRGAVAEPALASAGIDVIIPASTAAAPHRAAARFFTEPPKDGGF
jgi:hypothetical protein